MFNQKSLFSLLSTVFLCAALLTSCGVGSDELISNDQIDQENTSVEEGSTLAVDEITTNTSDEPVIYGADDRKEYYEITDEAEQRVADSTVALLDSGSLTSTANGYSIYVGQSFGSSYALCSSEPYRNQPNPAFCTGFQVGPDLIATAGHCINSSSCSDTFFAFNFHMEDSSTVNSYLPTSDVYQCSQVIGRAETSTNDFAVVRVDRMIEGHTALNIRTEGVVALGTSVIVSGHPAGLPLKVAGGATVQSNNHSDYFQSNLDTYGGNSGSPVFNSAGMVEGILVRGNTDFRYIRRRRCYVSNECNDSGCGGWEGVTRIEKILPFVPTTPVEPPPPECVDDVECADGDPCNGVETCVSGMCNSGAAVICEDANACVESSCQAISAVDWVCAESEVQCEDNDPCTVNGCDPAGGCFSTPLCSSDQVCEAGTCVDPPSCLPYRASCEVSSDCCSNFCHHRKKTCK